MVVNLNAIVGRTRHLRRLSFVGFLLGVLLPWGPGVRGQVEMPVERDSLQLNRLSVTGYPYIFYTPETEFALGGAIILSMRLDDDPKVKASNAILSGYYSVKGSYDIFLNPEFYLDEDRYYIRVSLDYYRFVDKFWGIGNATPDTGSVGYIRKIVWANLEFDVRVIGDLKIGLNYDLNITHIEDKQSNPFLLSGSVTGADGGVSSGIGGVLFMDTRNSPFYPTKGGYYKLSLLESAPWTGSDFNFKRWNLDLRHYFALAPPLVLAAQFYMSAIIGDPPFYMLPALGGDNIMRGYYEGRYRDMAYLAVQGELRVRLGRRWGLVGWVGLGDVAGNLNSLKLTSAKPSYGIGIRFALDPDQILNMRADFARGRDTKGVYFNAKEAF